MRLIAGIVPEIKEKMSLNKSQHISLLEILRIFIRQWVKNEIERRQHKSQSASQAEPSDKDYEDHSRLIMVDQLLKYIGDVILLLWQKGKIHTNRFSLSDIEDLDGHNHAELLKYFPLLYEEPGLYTFIHKSLIDYCLAEVWLKDFDLNSM